MRALVLLAVLLVAPAVAQTPEANRLTLREYVDTRFDAQNTAVNAALTAQKEAVAAALAAADRAVAKAEMASEKRFEGVNEFRASLNDQSRLLMPRAETEQIIRALDAKITSLQDRVDARDNRGVGMGALAGWIVAGVTLCGAVLALGGKWRALK